SNFLQLRSSGIARCSRRSVTSNHTGGVRKFRRWGFKFAHCADAAHMRASDQPEPRNRPMRTPMLRNVKEISAAEWDARCDLAALYRICDFHGWTDMIETHMTVRVPGEDDCLLIANYGDMFHEVTASSLIKVHFGGSIE